MTVGPSTCEVYNHTTLGYDAQGRAELCMFDEVVVKRLADGDESWVCVT